MPAMPPPGGLPNLPPAPTGGAIADALLEKGDMDGQRVWKRILEAVEELLQARPITVNGCTEGTGRPAIPTLAPPCAGLYLLRNVAMTLR